MKDTVLFATHDPQALQHLQAALADLCRVQVSASAEHTYRALAEGPFRAVIVDSRLPHMDSLGLAHALGHASAPNMPVVSWGALAPAVVFSRATPWDPVVVPHTMPELVQAARALLDPAAAGRTIQAVRYLPQEEAFFVAFQNGRTYELSRKVIEADDGSLVLGEPRPIDGGEAFEVRQKSGNTYDVAWDFVLYHQEPTYPYHKAKATRRAEEAGRAERIGARVRREREARGWSLADLASRTRMHGPNLSRLESGKHVPSLETLERVAEALGLRVVDLVSAR